MMPLQTRDSVRAARSALALGFVGLAAIGCATAIGPEEIPAEPIAFVYFDAETTRKRSEKISDAMSREG